jgi:hypothetical protein
MLSRAIGLFNIPGKLGIKERSKEKRNIESGFVEIETTKR